MMINTKSHDIYCIDKSYIERKAFNNIVQPINTIINFIAGYDTRYEEQQIDDGFGIEGISIRLFFHGEQCENSKLISFCTPFVQAGEKILRKRRAIAAWDLQVSQYR
jgi:hypothetical protein